MQVAITTRHGNIRDEVREHIAKKSEKLLTYFERVTSIGVTVDFEKDRVKVEILVETEHRQNLVAHNVGGYNEGGDVINVFDQALHKMEKQVRKYKEKLQDHRRDRPMNEVVDIETEEEDSEESSPEEEELI